MLKRTLVSLLISVFLLSPVSVFAQEYYPLTEDGTFYTFPEWYIVFSSQEYAQFLKNGGRPSEFNYLDSIKTYWQSYYTVTKTAIDRGYPFNFASHLMLGVIGVSFTGEYLIKAAYESTLGAMAEKSANYQPTFEDLYAQKVAEEYGEFLTHTPWFDFPFQEKLKGLWTQTPALSESPHRSIERKIALSIEYEFKALYGAAMHYATNFMYAPANPKVEVLTSKIPDEVLKSEPDIEIVNASESAGMKINLPRYKKFSEIAPRLLLSDVQFLEIAGHDEILITSVGGKETEIQTNSQILFETPIYSDESKKRAAILVKIPELHKELQSLKTQGFEAEHLFDY